MNKGDRELADLQFHGGEAYEITQERGGYLAKRRDDDVTMWAPEADSLRLLIRGNYRTQPVSRGMP